MCSFKNVMPRYGLVLLLGAIAWWPLSLAAQQEDCANAIDDDGNGLIDLNDPDCVCVLIEPESLIPNPSFEDLNCCPDNRSQLNCAESWIQASQPTTDLIHQCDWLGWVGLPPPLPFPDGEGIMGFRDGRPPRMQETTPDPSWKEYAGACLLNPLLAGNTYRFEFDVGFVNQTNSPNIDITFFGTTNCANLPFGQDDERLGCPTNGPNWRQLGQVRVNTFANGGWRKAAIEVTPAVDIAAIAIGPECADRPSFNSLYYFFDNLLLDELANFTFVITETAHPCAPGVLLQIPARPGLNYQWYKEGVALPGETANRLSRMYGEGGYEVVVDDGTSCQVADRFNYTIPTIQAADRVIKCQGEVFAFGDRELAASGRYQHTFTSFEGCDSTVTLDLTILGQLQDTVSGKIFPGEVFPVGRFDIEVAGAYDLVLPSSLGCDSLVRVELELYEVYQPTAFSPNNDGVNDTFTITGGADLVEVKALRVYDRWGNWLAEGNNWDGNDASARPLPPGLYVYTAVVVMDDGKERPLSGSVMLMR